MSKEKCIFCKIVRGEMPETEIVFESENVIVFKDIRPASDFHYLAVPREHIDNAKILTSIHIPLLNEMKNALDQTFLKDNINLKDASFGFHWPPFMSVAHLHLHGIAPVSRMRWLSKWIFRPNNIWYCTLEYVFERIEKLQASTLQATQ